MIEQPPHPCADAYRVDAQQRDLRWRMHGSTEAVVVLGFCCSRRPLARSAPRGSQSGRREMGAGMNLFRLRERLPLPSPWNDHANFSVR